LDALGRTTESADVMKKALPYGEMGELHQYARQLIGQKKSKEAFQVFKTNYDKHPDIYTTNMGMARGYSAVGDYKKALTYAQKAQVQAPNQPNKVAVANAIKTLQDGKDFN
jgi:Flp pilus assembly protein TadD